MTIITLYSAPTVRVKIVEASFTPLDNLLRSRSHLAAQSNIAAPWRFHVTNPDGDILKLTDTRLVGPQPLDVEVETDDREVLRARVSNLETAVADMQRRMAASQRIHISITAWQIMNSALGAPWDEGTDRHVPYNHPAIISLAGIAAITPQQFAKQAGWLIDRRNSNAAHCASAAALQQQVDECKLFITEHERSLYKWECWTIDNFDTIKQLFPDVFSGE